MYPRLRQLINNNDIQISGDVNICNLSHLCSLKSHFDNYFTDLEMDNYDWIRGPFNT
jgi:hypothetical protein